MMNYMKIEFDKMDVTLLPNFKGGEKEFAANMFFDGTNRIFKGRLVPGASIGMHTHDDSCEVIFILEGKGTIVEIVPSSGEESVSPVSAAVLSENASIMAGSAIPAWATTLAALPVPSPAPLWPVKITAWCMAGRKPAVL